MLETVAMSNGKFTVTFDEKEIPIDVEQGDTRKSSYGLAIDVGTTKLLLCLVDLTGGETLCTRQVVNPQGYIGEDVITRLQYARKGQLQKDELQKKVLNAINDSVKECSRKIAISQSNLYSATVVGNTAMHHLTLGLPVEELSVFPYRPATKKAVTVQANKS